MGFDCINFESLPFVLFFIEHHQSMRQRIGASVLILLLILVLEAVFKVLI